MRLAKMIELVKSKQSAIHMAYKQVIAASDATKPFTLPPIGWNFKIGEPTADGEYTIKLYYEDINDREHMNAVIARRF